MHLANVKRSKVGVLKKVNSKTVKNLLALVKTGKEQFRQKRTRRLPMAYLWYYVCH